MKWIIMILGSTILFFSSAKATNYFVKNSGSDINNGLSDGTAWQTASKAASTITQGDSVFFKRGDTWNEKFWPVNAGTSLSRVYVGAYGTGNDPVITGLTTVTGLADSSHVWSASIPSTVAYQNTVLVNGQPKAKGRYPNSTYLTANSATQTGLVGTLTGTPDFTGAECVFRTVHWVLDKPYISSQSTGTLTFRENLTYAPTEKGYFIQNSLYALDVNNEWYYDSLNKKIYVFYDSVSAPTVQISSIDTLVRAKAYYTFDGINFSGANLRAINNDSIRGVTIQNCTIEKCGTYGIVALNASKLSLLNNTIQDIWNCAVFTYYNNLATTSDSSTITGNTIRRISTAAGMGLKGTNTYVGMVTRGKDNYIFNNRFDTIGFNGILFNGKRTILRKNYVNYTNYVKDDGAGIYTVIGTAYPDDFNDGSIVDSNIVINGIGASAGTATTSYGANIYFDDGAKNITVSNNFLQNGFTASMFFHNTDSLTVTGNTVVDSLGTVVKYATASNGNVFTNNTLYSQSASQLVLEVGSTFTGTFSGNHYVRRDTTNLLKYIGTSYNLSAWKTARGWDANSTLIPTGITEDLPQIIYNDSLEDTTINLEGYYASAKGQLLTGDFVIPSFYSAILFNSTYVPQSLGTKINYKVVQRQ